MTVVLPRAIVLVCAARADEADAADAVLTHTIWMLIPVKSHSRVSIRQSWDLNWTEYPTRYDVLAKSRPC